MSGTDQSERPIGVQSATADGAPGGKPDPSLDADIARRVGALFAPDAVLSLSPLAQTYQGREQIGALVHQLLAPDRTMDAPLRVNKAGQITSLVLPISAERSEDDGDRTERNGKRVPWYLPFLGGALVAGLPEIGTFLGIAFDLFPALKPEPPPEIRAVTVTELALGERDRDLGDGRIADVVHFEVETVGYVGYDEDNMAVDWLLFDAQTRERLPERQTPERWDVIDIGTRSDCVTGEIMVPPPVDHTGCIFVRVLLQPEAATDDTTDPAAPRLLLDVADSAPYNPVEPTNPSCRDAAMPTPGSTQAALRRA